MCGLLRRVPPLQSVNDDAVQVQRQRRAGLEHLLKRGQLDAGQHGVTQCGNGRPSRLIRERAHFADAFAPADLADDRERVVGQRDARLQSATDDEVERVTRIAFVEQQLAAGPLDPLDRQQRADRLERGVVEIAEQRGQRLAERFGGSGGSHAGAILLSSTNHTEAILRLHPGSP